MHHAVDTLLHGMGRVKRFCVALSVPLVSGIYKPAWIYLNLPSYPFGLNVPFEFLFNLNYRNGETHER